MASRETLNVDVLYIGAGPANLASAIHLKQLIKSRNDRIRRGEIKGPPLEEPDIVILEKGPQLGSHIISGAILDPRALAELCPNFTERETPVRTRVREDHFYFLSPRRRFRFPFLPPSIQNHGGYIISLGELVEWLGNWALKEGIQIFFGFPGQEILWEGNRVRGVKTGEKGIDRSGRQKAQYEPGIDLEAKVTVFGEGTHGSLVKSLVNRLALSQERNPQVYSMGIKELWKVPPQNHREGWIAHTLGFPLDSQTFGGGFIYHAARGQISIGLVVGLDYRDPRLDPHKEFQRFKRHPWIQRMLEGGQPLGYGAKVIPEGGYLSLPRYYGEGFLITGDSAGFLDSMRLKGIHLAMKSGMLAAETIFEALLSRDFSEKTLSDFERRVEASWVKEELWRVRNFHQGFKSGLYGGLVRMGFQLLAGGRDLFGDRTTGVERDDEAMRKIECVPRLEMDGDGSPRQRGQNNVLLKVFNLGRFFQIKSMRTGPVRDDGVMTFDKRTDLSFSGTRHEEDQPCHLIISDLDVCHQRCTHEYGNPCQYFCPANVYEMVEERGGEKRLHLNPSNCVHCKACDIKDPYQIINWVTPEGGGGPQYRGM